MGKTVCFKREFGNITVDRDTRLQFTHYKVADSTEIYISDELRVMGVSFKRLKDFATEELQRVTIGPFGDTNIDPHSEEKFARESRAINKLSCEIQAQLQVPVAIKSLIPELDEGLGAHLREDLVEQYLFMRNLQFVSQEKMNQRQKEVIEFLLVYGVIRCGNSEFLIMKRVVDAHEISDKLVPFRSCGWPGSGDPDSELAFEASEHPELMAVLFDEAISGLVLWRDIGQAFYQLLRIKLPELAGRNVMFNVENGRKKYHVIDQIGGK